MLGHGVSAGTLTLGTDNGAQFTSRGFRRHLSDRGITHRRSGYRDPESQAFIESRFGQFKKRVAWRAEWETIDQARKEITEYIDTYPHRPHSGLRYRTPDESPGPGGHSTNQRPEADNHDGVHVTALRSSRPQTPPLYRMI